jgi:hypothetical protein
MKNDSDIIKESYEKVVHRLFDVYFQNVIAEPKDADDRFLRGLQNARTAKDRAIQLAQKSVI